MPSDDARQQRVPLGPVGGYVIRNLSRFRGRLTYRELSERLSQLGRPIPTLGLSRIERGERRVDVDDLMALAIALGVNPIALLIPEDAGPDEVIDLTPRLRLKARDARDWITGWTLLPENDVVTWPQAEGVRLVREVAFLRNELYAMEEQLAATRQRAMEEALAAAGTAQQPKREDELPSVATAIVTSSRGVLVGRRNDGKPPWTFIAGEVEEGETPEFAATREVKEETGLEARARDEIGRRVHPRTGREMIYIAAEPVRPDDLEVFVGDEAELAEVRWVTLAEADELMAEYGMYEPVHEYLAREIGEA